MKLERHAPTGSVRSPRRTVGAAYAACAWAWAFAAVSFYWALGGTVGLATLGTKIEQLALARDPTMLWVGGWGAGVAKFVGGLLPLALVQPWGERMPRRLLRLLVWAGGIGMALYGIASFVQHSLMMSGIIRLPEGLGRTGAAGHLILWDPWWTLGGILYIITAWSTTRSARRPHFPQQHDHTPRL